MGRCSEVNVNLTLESKTITIRERWRNRERRAFREQTQRELEASSFSNGKGEIVSSWKNGEAAWWCLSRAQHPVGRAIKVCLVACTTKVSVFFLFVFSLWAAPPDQIHQSWLVSCLRGCSVNAEEAEIELSYKKKKSWGEILAKDQKQ